MKKLLYALLVVLILWLTFGKAQTGFTYQYPVGNDHGMPFWNPRLNYPTSDLARD